VVPVLVPDLKARCNWTFGGIYDLECYGRTKAMQVLLAKAWSRAYPNITIGAVHPGAINSEIFQPLYTRSDDVSARFGLSVCLTVFFFFFFFLKEFAKAIYMPKFLGGILKKVLAPLLEALVSNF
jgi:NAD(P)-dependent dehydrogenase (short-subunit alcohol dehydrogenase family)